MSIPVHSYVCLPSSLGAFVAGAAVRDLSPLRYLLLGDSTIPRLTLHSGVTPFLRCRRPHYRRSSRGTSPTYSPCRATCLTCMTRGDLNSDTACHFTWTDAPNVTDPTYYRPLVWAFSNGLSYLPLGCGTCLVGTHFGGDGACELRSGHLHASLTTISIAFLFLPTADAFWLFFHAVLLPTYLIKLPGYRLLRFHVQPFLAHTLHLPPFHVSPARRVRTCLHDVPIRTLLPAPFP